MAQPHHHIIRSHLGGHQLLFLFPYLHIDLGYEVPLRVNSAAAEQKINKDLVIVAIIYTDIADSRKQKYRNTGGFSFSYL